MSHNGRHVPPHERIDRRRRTIAIVVALVLVAFGVGFVVAASLGEADPTVETPTVTGSGPPSETPPATGDADPTPVLEDGQHFVQPTSVAALEDGSYELTFDLALFYTGAEAFEVAQEQGIELDTDHYIDNDARRLRTLPLAADATIEYIPAGTCCELQPGDVDAFAESVNGGNQTDLPDPETTWWWATAEDGVVTGLVQQYLS